MRHLRTPGLLLLLAAHLPLPAFAVVTVALTPASVQLLPGQSQAFQATVSGTPITTVQWTLSAPVGTISSAGVYTAPAQLDSPQSIRVIATSVANKSSYASATILVLSSVSVSTSPATFTLNAGQTKQFAAAVTGTFNSGVAWSISPQIGTISPTGLYSAPAMAVGTQVLRVMATSLADKNKYSTAVVTVPSSVAVSVTPNSATVDPGGTLQMATTVTGTPNPTVNWSTTFGTVSQSGIYTAPPQVSTPRSIKVYVKSAADPNAYAAATILVRSSVSVAASPQAVTINAGQSQLFAATVTGTNSTAVVWSVSPTVGTIDTTGKYTAPTSVSGAQVLRITATSTADNSRYATALVTVKSSVALSLSPQTASVTAGDTKKFIASVTGTGNTAVTWSTTLGKIDPDGLYHAPTSLSQQQTARISATSAADPTASAVTTVTISPAYSISVSPLSATLYSSQSQQFLAKSTFSGSTAVKWAASDGNITSTGLYTAPAYISAPRMITITATSSDAPSKIASATVQLQPPVSVNVSPVNISLGAGQSIQFIPQVTNTSTTTVSWALSPSFGTISSSGYYTAPSQITYPLVVVVTATSVVDATKVATALVALQSAPTPPQQPSQTTSSGPLLAGLVNYGSNYLSSALIDQVLYWQSRRFTWFIGGKSLKTYNSSAKWLGYVEGSYIYADETSSVEQYASSHGFAAEDLFLHFHTDYTVSSSLSWSGMDQFDAFEKSTTAGGPTTAKNGVFLVNGDTYTDKTVAAYDTTVGDVSISDRLLLGYGQPFAEIHFLLARAAVGTTISWSYWNGTNWQPLSITDGTGGLSQNGVVTFVPPSDWRAKSENGSREKWWIRATVAGTGVTPIASRIYGDDWSAPAPNNCRGWAPSDPSRVNVGLGALEYNPNPPATASARFRYQARATGLWGRNATFGNPGNIQSGQRTWAGYIASKAIALATAGGYDGILFDDGTSSPSISAPSNAIANSSDWSGTTFLADQTAQYTAALTLIKSALPSTIVGINSNVSDVAMRGDFSLNEQWTYTYASGNVRFAKSTVIPYTSFDDYLTPSNSHGTVGILMFMDTSYDDPLASGDQKPFYFERANRRPILALSAYYIGANDHTVFEYNSAGTVYSATDEFYYYDPRTTALTASLTALATGGAKTITGADFSSFPASGTIRVGDYEHLAYTKSSITTLSTSDPLYLDHNAGETVAFVGTGHQSTDSLPPLSQIQRWANWFPAMGVDIGTPDPSGYNGGSRDLVWRSGSVIGGGEPIWRRDYTNAIVLHRPATLYTTAAQFSTYCSPVALGGTYYPLLADGTTGDAVTSISLRTGEGAILMKTPR